MIIASRNSIYILHILQYSNLTYQCSYLCFQMAEYFNNKSGLSEKVPLGSFNSMFSFTGSWKIDAATTKALAVDGYLVPLCEVKLMNPELVLCEDVKRAVPSSWDPPSLARLVGNKLVCIVTRYCHMI